MGPFRIADKASLDRVTICGIIYITENNMKTFILENNYDGNDRCEIRAYSYEDALVEALEVFGYNLLEVETDEDE